MSPIPIATAIFSENSPVFFGKGLSESPLGQLRIGDTVDAEILKILDHGRLLAKLGDLTVVAEAQIPFSPGQKVLLQVQSLNPQILLRLLSNEGGKNSPGPEVEILNFAPEGELKGILNSLTQTGLQTFPGEGEEARLLEPFLKALSHLALSSENLSPQKVREVLLRSGFFLEGEIGRSLKGRESAKAAEGLRDLDLKSLLLEIRRQMEGSGTIHSSPAQGNEGKERWAFLLSAVRSALDHFEFQQVTRWIPGRDEYSFCFPIPLKFDESLSWGDLIVFRDREKRDGKKREGPVRFLLRLSLEELGKIEFEARLHRERVSLKVRCEDPSLARFVSEQIPALREKLGGWNLNLEDVECIGLGNRRKVSNPRGSLVAPSGKKMVDIKI